MSKQLTVGQTASIIFTALFFGATIYSFESCRESMAEQGQKEAQEKTARDNREKELYRECMADYSEPTEPEKQNCARTASSLLADEKLDQYVKKTEQEHIDKLEH